MFVRSRTTRSRYNLGERHSPAQPPPIVVAPMPRRSVFRDAAAVAGGVTVGTTMGHLAGEAISSMFGGRRRQEVVEVLPRDYQMDQAPTGPCAYEIATFLQCAVDHENLQECAAFNEALKKCKQRNGELTFVPPDRFQHSSATRARPTRMFRHGLKVYLN